jgi:hypothetical protein
VPKGARRSPSAVVAEAIESLASEMDEQRRLLEQILQVCRDNADGLSQHRQHAMSAVSDLGERVKQLETRLR